MNEFRITELKGTQLTMHTTVPVEVNTKFKLEISDIEIELTVISCTGYSTLYIVVATLSSEIRDLEHLLTSYKHDVDKVHELYQTYQKTAESAILKLSIAYVKQQNDLDMYSSLITVINYLNTNVTNGNNIYHTISDIITEAIGLTNVSIYSKSRNGYYNLKYTNSRNVAHHKMIKDHNNNVKNKIYTHKNILNREYILSETALDKDNKIKSIMGIPFKENDTVNYLVLEHITSEGFTNSQIKYIDIINAQLSNFFKTRKLYAELRDTANKDGLTGLYKRDYLITKLQDSISNGATNYAIAMVDLDDFKNCNDTFGHLFGDEVLKAVSKVYQNKLRKTDIVARYGGEEIICCFLDIKDQNAIYQRLEEIRKEVEKIKIGNIDYHPTISTGLAYASSTSGILSLIDNADKALYKAKRTGKNKVIRFDQMKH